MMLSLLHIVLAASPLLLQTGAKPLPELKLEQASDSTGAVASESEICSHIGIDLLQQGGNAADAVGLARKHARSCTNSYSSWEPLSALGLSACIILVLVVGAS
jgi:hypothetical protein